MLPETGIHPLTLAVSLYINLVVEKLKAAGVRVECRGRLVTALLYVDEAVSCAHMVHS